MAGAHRAHLLQQCGQCCLLREPRHSPRYDPRRAPLSTANQHGLSHGKPRRSGSGFERRSRRRSNLNPNPDAGGDGPPDCAQAGPKAAGQPVVHKRSTLGRPHTHADTARQPHQPARHHRRAPQVRLRAAGDQRLASALPAHRAGAHEFLRPSPTPTRRFLPWGCFRQGCCTQGSGVLYTYVRPASTVERSRRSCVCVCVCGRWGA